MVTRIGEGVKSMKESNMRLAQEVEADGKASGGAAVSPTRFILVDIASTFQLDSSRCNGDSNAGDC